MTWARLARASALGCALAVAAMLGAAVRGGPRPSEGEVAESGCRVTLTHIVVPVPPTASGGGVLLRGRAGVAQPALVAARARRRPGRRSRRHWWVVRRRRVFGPRWQARAAAGARGRGGDRRSAVPSPCQRARVGDGAHGERADRGGPLHDGRRGASPVSRLDRPTDRRRPTVHRHGRWSGRRARGDANGAVHRRCVLHGRRPPAPPPRRDRSRDGRRPAVRSGGCPVCQCALRRGYCALRGRIDRASERAAGERRRRRCADRCCPTLRRLGDRDSARPGRDARASLRRRSLRLHRRRAAPRSCRARPRHGIADHVRAPAGRRSERPGRSRRDRVCGRRVRQRVGQAASRPCCAVPIGPADGMGWRPPRGPGAATGALH